jgi:hypothetical protein
MRSSSMIAETGGLLLHVHDLLPYRGPRMPGLGPTVPPGLVVNSSITG